MYPVPDFPKRPCVVLSQLQHFPKASIVSQQSRISQLLWFWLYLNSLWHKLFTPLCITILPAVQQPPGRAADLSYVLPGGSRSPDILAGSDFIYRACAFSSNSPFLGLVLLALAHSPGPQMTSDLRNWPHISALWDDTFLLFAWVFLSVLLRAFMGFFFWLWNEYTWGMVWKCKAKNVEYSENPS